MEFGTAFVAEEAGWGADERWSSTICRAVKTWSDSFSSVRTAGTEGTHGEGALGKEGVFEPDLVLTNRNMPHVQGEPVKRCREGRLSGPEAHDMWIGVQQ